jgi:predicted site-specific integrase-resolvase
MTEKQVARLLGLSPHTLAVWRSSGRVRIPYVKLGRAVRYRREVVLDVIRSSEPPRAADLETTP